MNRAIVFLCSILFFSCRSSSLNTSCEKKIAPYPFEKENVEYEFENRDDNSVDLFNRKDSNVVIFSFFSEFNDTVRIIFNGRKVLEEYIYKDTNKVSSDYSGFSFGVNLESGIKDEVRFELVNKKKYAIIRIDKNYPLCTLTRKNNLWTANYRKKMLILK